MNISKACSPCKLSLTLFLTHIFFFYIISISFFFITGFEHSPIIHLIMKEKHMKKYNFENASGPVEYNMTNDYMFRIILQENKLVLRGLICSLLHIDDSDIQSVEITNPITPGESINEKEFVLDVNILFNNETIINLEMQMANNGNWTDRSLSYLCRNFTHLQKGHDYIEAKPVIHIGFLNFNLFDNENDEFYSKYQFLNVKTHHLFSSKLTIGVVYLNKVELATEEDKASSLDKWVALFKSKTWEELKMIAQQSPLLAEATEALYNYNHEDVVRFQCYAREDYQKQQNSIERDKKIIAEQESKLAELEQTLVEKDLLIAELEAKLKQFQKL